MPALPLAAQDLAPIAFFLTVIIFGVVGIILWYHWRRFAIVPGSGLFWLWIYLAVGLGLLLLMAIFGLAL